MERSLSCACLVISIPDLGGVLGAQICFRCVPFILRIVTFSRRRLENLLQSSGKSRQCLDFLQIARPAEDLLLVGDRLRGGG